MDVKVVFCKPCGFQNRALDLANEILNRFGLDGVSVTLVPGKNGIFDVYVDNEMVFSRYKEKRFPEHQEIIEQVDKRLQQAKAR
jgi:selT/selW/selH-like putative selenoprotein